ncbi:uL15 family ribosomal protein [Candidatus Parcubacteria bacterium]|nr:uL15 family ribosomal protein [Patescibacteria group bacterium]MBU4466495.1 uL15 family ribosomal protein [Patescibacteria group bacterium]MCG2688234.1 uL15 family ribosomal protein [Candidatus Parcubacteria bacterium]
MQLHQVKQTHKRNTAKRRGRGGKKGTYSGRGIKGQKSRAGMHLKPIIREIMKRYPKLKGHRSSVLPRIRFELNLGQIEKAYIQGETVNRQTLAKKGLISLPKKKTFELKLLGTGYLTKPLVFEGCTYTASALAKIKKSKSTIK